MVSNVKDFSAPVDNYQSEKLENVPPEHFRDSFLARFHQIAKDDNEYMAFRGLLLSFDAFIYHYKNMKNIWKELTSDEFAATKDASQKKHYLTLEVVAYLNHLGRIADPFSQNRTSDSGLIDKSFWEQNVAQKKLTSLDLHTTTIADVISLFRHKYSAHMSYFYRKKESDEEVFSHLICSCEDMLTGDASNGFNLQAKLETKHIVFHPLQDHDIIIESIQICFSKICEEGIQ